MIAQYDEGASNRQVWNDVALLAAARSLGDAAAAEEAVYRTSGIASHLSNGLLADGTWYEGENYHLFAHRGLWYGVTMAELAGLELPPALIARFDLGFSAPFATALPDFTLPSRRDSQYAISLRQWRIAEHCELGLARRDDASLTAALAHMYGDDIPRMPNGPRSFVGGRRAQRTRDRADARGPVVARAAVREAIDCPRPKAVRCRRTCSSRRESPSSVATVAARTSRSTTVIPAADTVILIVSTFCLPTETFAGSTTTAPALTSIRRCTGIAARSRTTRRSPTVSRSDAFTASCSRTTNRGTAGWIVAAVDEIAPGVNASRVLIVMPSYVIDCLSWEADHEATIDLPVHASLDVESGCGPLARAAIVGRDGAEDGFRFLRDTAVQIAAAGAPVKAVAADGL